MSAPLTEDNYGMFENEDESAVIYVDEFRHLEKMVKEQSAKVVEQGKHTIEL